MLTELTVLTELTGGVIAESDLDDAVLTITERRDAASRRGIADPQRHFKLAAGDTRPVADDLVRPIYCFVVHTLPHSSSLRLRGVPGTKLELGPGEEEETGGFGALHDHHD